MRRMWLECSEPPPLGSPSHVPGQVWREQVQQGGRYPVSLPPIARQAKSLSALVSEVALAAPRSACSFLLPDLKVTLSFAGDSWLSSPISLSPHSDFVFQLVQLRW